MKPRSAARKYDVQPTECDIIAKNRSGDLGKIGLSIEIPCYSELYNGAARSAFEPAVHGFI